MAKKYPLTEKMRTLLKAYEAGCKHIRVLDPCEDFQLRDEIERELDMIEKELEAMGLELCIAI